MRSMILAGTIKVYSQEQKKTKKKTIVIYLGNYFYLNKVFNKRELKEIRIITIRTQQNLNLPSFFCDVFSL